MLSSALIPRLLFCLSAGWPGAAVLCLIGRIEAALDIPMFVDREPITGGTAYQAMI